MTNNGNLAFAITISVYAQINTKTAEIKKGTWHNKVIDKIHNLDLEDIIFEHYLEVWSSILPFSIVVFFSVFEKIIC